MDPFVHPYALEDVEVTPWTAWSGRELWKGLRRGLKRSRSTRETRTTAKDARESYENDRSETQSSRPMISARRSSLRRSRRANKKRIDASPKRRLSFIPEVEDGEELECEKSIETAESQSEELLLPLPPKASLLGLPRELRDLIYDHVFDDWGSASNALSLLRTCKQIHSEGSVPAYRRTLFRVHKEHWPDHDFFQARYVSRIPASLVPQIQNLALHLPRGMPYDRYASSALHADLALYGFRLTTLVIFSAMPRPLPHISVYGGVLEASLCHWLKGTLYAMPSLSRVCILNYESPTPTFHDMPSPRLVRMLRSAIFEDVLAECETLSERSFEWRCLTDSLESSMSNCTDDEKTYHIYSAKLARSVEIVFRSDKFLVDYGLEHLRAGSAHAPASAAPGGADPLMLQDSPMTPDCPLIRAYAGLRARRTSTTWSGSEDVGKRLADRAPWSGLSMASGMLEPSATCKQPRHRLFIPASQTSSTFGFTRMKTLGRRLTMSH